MADVSTISVLIKAKDEASKVLENVQTKMGGMAAGFEKHRKSIGLGMTIVGGALTAISVSSIKAASDVEEMQGKFNTVFGELSKETEEWARTHAKAANRNRFDLMEYASTLQDTFVPMGFARDRAAEFAKSVTELSVDLGSFNNLKTADVVRDMQSALVGNTETVRKYGVVITAASVETEIMNQGWASSKGEITEAMKVQARMNMIIAGTSDAQGDAIRTSGSFANQMLGLQASMKEAQVTLGQALLPAITALVAAITPVLISMAEWMKENEGLAKVLILVGAGLGAVMLVLGPMLLILPQLFAGFKLMAAGIRLVTAAMAANPVGAILAVLTTLAIVVLPLVIKNWDSIWAKIKTVTQSAVNFVIGLLNKMTLLWRKQIEFILDMVAKLMELGSKLPFVGDKFKVAAEAIKGFSDKIKEGIPQIDITAAKQEELQDAVNDTATTFEGAGEIIETEQKKVGESAKDTAGVVVKSNEKIGGSTEEMAQTMSVAWGGIEDQIMRSSGVYVKSLEEMELESARFTANERLGIVSRINVREQERQDFIDGINKANAATAARQEVEARAAQAISDSWTTFKQDQDVTMKALSDSNIGFMDLVEGLALRHNVSTSQMADELAKSGVRMNDTWALLQTQGAASVNGLIGEYQKLSREAQFTQEAMEKFGDITIQGMSIEDFLNKGFSQFEATNAFEAQVKKLEGEALRLANRMEDVGGRAEEREAGSIQRSISALGVGTGETTVLGAFQTIQESAKWGAPGHREKIKGMTEESILDAILESAGAEAALGSHEAIRAAGLADLFGLDKKQRGGLSRGGMTLVGERGPELVNLPGGAMVHPNGTGPGGVTNQFHFHGAVYGVEDLKEAVVEAVRDHAISGGFSGVFAEA